MDHLHMLKQCREDFDHSFIDGTGTFTAAGNRQGGQSGVESKVIQRFGFGPPAEVLTDRVTRYGQLGLVWEVNCGRVGRQCDPICEARQNFEGHGGFNIRNVQQGGLCKGRDRHWESDVTACKEECIRFECPQDLYRRQETLEELPDITGKLFQAHAMHTCRRDGFKWDIQPGDQFFLHTTAAADPQNRSFFRIEGFKNGYGGIHAPARSARADQQPHSGCSFPRFDV